MSPAHFAALTMMVILLEISGLTRPTARESQRIDTDAPRFERTSDTPPKIALGHLCPKRHGLTTVNFCAGDLRCTADLKARLGMEKLVVCGVCHRHVKHRDAACPFCKSAISPVRGAVGLAGVVAVGLTLGLAACTSSGSGGSGGGTTTGDGGALPAYGAPAWDSGAGGMVEAYGPPPPTDAGTGGGSVTAYGPPPPEDAGPPIDSGDMPAYAPPPPPSD